MTEHSGFVHGDERLDRILAEPGMAERVTKIEAEMSAEELKPKRVKLYLDVDGCLNHFRESLWPGKDKKGTANGFTIKWSPELVEALSELDVDLHWMSTWRSECRTKIAKLVGWGHDGVVIHPKLSPKAETIWPSTDWKLGSLKMHQKLDPSPFIVVDDDYSAADMEIVRDLGGLMIRPNPLFGITPDDIEDMKFYIESMK